MKISHFTIKESSVISAFAFAVGMVCAIVPQWSHEQQAIIAGGTSIITAAFPLWNAIHAAASSKLSSKDLEADLAAFAKAEVGKVNFDSLVADAMKANGLKGLESEIGASVQAELRRILGQTPVAPASAVPVVQTAPAASQQ